MTKIKTYLKKKKRKQIVMIVVVLFFFLITDIISLDKIDYKLIKICLINKRKATRVRSKNSHVFLSKNLLPPARNFAACFAS